MSDSGQQSRDFPENTTTPDKNIVSVAEVIGDFISKINSGKKTKEVPLDDISDQYAGIIFAFTQLISSKIITPHQGTNLLRKFYEYDTGKLLRVGQLEKLLTHDKVKKYESSIMPNIMQRSKKDEILQGLKNSEVGETNETSEMVKPIELDKPNEPSEVGESGNVVEEKKLEKNTELTLSEAQILQTEL